MVDNNWATQNNRKLDDSNAGAKFNDTSPLNYSWLNHKVPFPPPIAIGNSNDGEYEGPINSEWEAVRQVANLTYAVSPDSCNSKQAA